TNALMARNISLYRALGYTVEGEAGQPGAVAVRMRKAVARRLVFLPGAAGSASFWRPLGERLPAHWKKTYLSWPGLGFEAHAPQVRGMDDLVRLVESAVGDGPADLLAQSMGGVPALAFALGHPGRVRRLVLTATSGGVDAAARAAALHDWRASYRRNYPLAADWIRLDRTDLTDRLAQVAAPTLLLFGDADPIAPPFVGKRLAELLPNATLHVLPGAGHDLAALRPEAADLAYDHLR
ncbi:MAG: alpha/beta fold hydrolase, partial [Phenylobacterium sp.]